jgi:CBS domain-containing protein
MANVSELMTPEPVKVSMDTPIADCARILWRLGLRHLPVVAENGAFLGVVTDFDLLQFGEIISDDGTWADRGSARMTAGEAARTLAVACRPDDDLLDVLREMRDLQVDVAVVVDNRRHPIGVLTEHDAVRWSRAFVGLGPTIVHPDASVHVVDRLAPGFTAFDTMIENGVRHLIVMDRGEIFGVLSWRDLVVEDLLGWRTVRVGELVRGGEPITAPVGTTLRELADLMVKHKIGCVPLLDQAGKLAAVVSRSDIVGAVLNMVPADHALV